MIQVMGLSKIEVRLKNEPRHILPSIPILMIQVMARSKIEAKLKNEPPHILLYQTAPIGLKEFPSSRGAMPTTIITMTPHRGPALKFISSILGILVTLPFL
jgi:hypothetical protein